MDLDPRWKQLGRLLVGYSTRVGAGERVMIAMGEVETFPLARAVYEAAVCAGAFPQVQFLSERLRHSLLRHGNEQQVAWVPEIEALGMDWADVYFGLRGAYNLFQHADISVARLASNQQALGKISSMRWQKTRWCLVRVPNAAFAQQAEGDEERITDMFFDACLIDWEAAAAEWQRWADWLSAADEVRVVGRGTDLRFSVAGRRWMVGAGRLNMPDGEIATAPVEDSLDGHIAFEFPGVLSGRQVEGIRLRFERGKLVDASAERGEPWLHSVLATDADARRVGEFGIGTNPAIDRFSKDILLDEKIGGTVHIALGRAYPECGGTNHSAIHWDIVKDTRSEGAVYVDGVPVLQDGALDFERLVSE